MKKRTKIVLISLGILLLVIGIFILGIVLGYKYPSYCGFYYVHSRADQCICIGEEVDNEYDNEVMCYGLNLGARNF